MPGQLEGRGPGSTHYEGLFPGVTQQAATTLGTTVTDDIPSDSHLAFLSRFYAYVDGLDFDAGVREEWRLQGAMLGVALYVWRYQSWNIQAVRDLVTSLGGDYDKPPATRSQRRPLFLPWELKGLRGGKRVYSICVVLYDTLYTVILQVCLRRVLYVITCVVGELVKY